MVKRPERLLIGLLLLAGCAAPLRPPVETVPETVPGLEKTHGEIKTDKDGALMIEYKTIKILVDPGASNAWDSAQIDYLLLTQTPAAALSVRRDLKIMAPPPLLGALQKAGYTQVKSVSSGQRLFLKKDEAFLFAGAATAGQGEKMKNGYLLEFDNGRNIFVSGRLNSADALREFVFSLRDDGKELHAAVVAADSDVIAVEAIALLQPHFAYYDPAPRAADRKRLEKTLADQLFSGGLIVLKRGESIPF